ncbi:protein PIF-like [Melanaphis sacchari]|uniref:protein PIF-like n=1 Tax=Melanaphis sacchari TaxID=742174 RepID=UPI000DC14281|nr:protein PIF-like [Melanaphis sacchari]
MTLVLSFFFVLSFNVIIFNLPSSHGNNSGYHVSTLSQILTPSELIRFNNYGILPSRVYYSYSKHAYVVRGQAGTYYKNDLQRKKGKNNRGYKAIPRWKYYLSKLSPAGLINSLFGHSGNTGDEDNLDEDVDDNEEDDENNGEADDDKVDEKDGKPDNEKVDEENDEKDGKPDNEKVDEKDGKPDNENVDEKDGKPDNEKVDEKDDAKDDTKDGAKDDAKDDTKGDAKDNAENEKANRSKQNKKYSGMLPSGRFSKFPNMHNYFNGKGTKADDTKDKSNKNDKESGMFPSGLFSGFPNMNDYFNGKDNNNNDKKEDTNADDAPGYTQMAKDALQSDTTKELIKTGISLFVPGGSGIVTAMEAGSKLGSMTDKFKKP